MAPNLGGSQNAVDLDTDSFGLDLAYRATPKIWINGGFDTVGASGHYDPAGLYNTYALANGQANFKNIDSTQFIPHLGVDWNINEKTLANITARHYDTNDKVDPIIASTTHPFNWSGWQVSTEFKVSF